jgi:hypothetical protein
MLSVLLGLAAATPAVIFSSTSSLGGHGYRELPMNVDSKALEGTIEGLLGKPGSESLLETASTKPVVFLDAEGASTAALQTLTSGKSAVGLPYASELPVGSAVFRDATVATSAAELDQALAGRQLPQLLVIRSPEAVSLLQKVNAVSQDYVGVAVAAGAASARMLVGKKEEGPVIPVQSIPVTPAILTGLLTGLVWLIIFFSGVCCLMNLSTPDRFEEKVLQLNKEY